MNNGALDEAMEIMKGSLADNSQVEKPYRTTGEIFVNGNGDIDYIFVKGIIVDFTIRNYPDPSYLRIDTDETLINNGMKKDKDGDWFYPDNVSSREKKLEEDSYPKSGFVEIITF
jgi:hypothetical protein